MSYKLFVGDVAEYLSIVAKEFDASSQLLIAGQKPESGNTYYTSLADMESLQNFIDVCTNAQHIIYAPPQAWNNKPQQHSQQHWTEYLLTNISQAVPVDNLPDYRKKYALNPNTVEQYSKLEQRDKNLLSIEPLDVRKSDSPQIWASGCSITYGVGVELHETWRELVRKQLDLPLSNLSESGTSISWAANQILQSDIREGDYVLWGLTAHTRFLVVDSESESIVHLNPAKFNESNIRNKFPLEYIDSDTTIVHNINAIRNVYNFCKKVNAKLVIQGVSLDWDNTWKNYNVPCFEQTVIWPANGTEHHYLDLGTDNKHPGPKQHTYYAKKFLELIEKWYG